MKRNHMLVRHEPSAVDLDVSFARLPFELDAIARSEVIDYAGVSIRVSRPDDLVIYKLVAARPRDLDDESGCCSFTVPRWTSDESSQPFASSPTCSRTPDGSTLSNVS